MKIYNAKKIKTGKTCAPPETYPKSSDIEILRGITGKGISGTPLSAMPGTPRTAAHKSLFNTHVFVKSTNIIAFLSFS